MVVANCESSINHERKFPTMSVQALHRAQSPGLAARQACPSARQPSSSIAWRVGSSSKAAKAHRTPFLASPPPPCRRSSQGAWRLASPVAAIRGVQDFDGTFTLEQQQQETLVELLTSDLFCQQVGGSVCRSACCCTALLPAPPLICLSSPARRLCASASSQREHKWSSRGRCSSR